MTDSREPAAKIAKLEELDLSFSELVQSEKQNSALGDFGRSFLHTVLQAPIEGVAQLIDGKSNGETQKLVHFIDAPVEAKIGTSNWLAQQAGSALGAILPVLIIHKSVSADAQYESRAALAMSENMLALSSTQKLEVSGTKALEYGLTGLIYSGIFTPSKDSEKNFWESRRRNAVVGGLTFATLSSSGLALQRLGESAEAAVPTLSSFIKSDLGSGMISGIPAGLVAANSDSLISGHGFARSDKQIQAALGFAITGAGFAYGKSLIAEIRPDPRISEAPATFAEFGVDVDGRPLAESGRAAVSARLPDYSAGEMGRAREQTLKDLSEIKALEPGKSVLDQFSESGLSISQKYRVLNSLAQVREQFVNQRINAKIEPDQQGNWIHTLGEFGRVIDASKAGKLSAIQTEDSLLSSMFADAIKSKANFFNHHMDGALAADHALSNQFGDGFTRSRLDGIVNAIKEHQIGPPEFMSKLYAGRIKGALNFTLTAEQESALASLQKKIADPLNPNIEKYTTPEGSSALVLTAEEKDLLRLTGTPEWYVPSQTNPWNDVSRAVIDGDSIDNYFTAGGIGKIASLGGPESDKWFMTKQLDNAQLQADSTSNIGSARMSGVDAWKLLTPASRTLAQSSLAQTEAAIASSKEQVANWLLKEKGIDPSKQEVPFFNSELKYPQFGEADSDWWNIHRMPNDKRSIEQQKFYDEHRFDGLTAEEQEAFLLAKDIRELAVNTLRAAQRLDGQQASQYEPATER